MSIELKYTPASSHDGGLESATMVLDEDIWYPESFVDNINSFIKLTGHTFEVELVDTALEIEPANVLSNEVKERAAVKKVTNILNGTSVGRLHEDLANEIVEKVLEVINEINSIGTVYVARSSNNES